MQCNTLDTDLLEQKKQQFSQFDQLQQQHFAAVDIHCATNALLTQRSAKIDQLIANLWLRFQFSTQLVIVAVGGYGRGELFPNSDIDLLIISENPNDEPAIRRLIQFLWDLKFKVGSSVRNLQDCFALYADDVSVQTNYLENRFVCGNWQLYVLFSQQLKQTKVL